MLPRTSFLAKLMGAYAIIVALASVTHKQSIVETTTMLIDDRPLVLIVGLLGLIAGLTIVLCHNIWSGGVSSIVVTLLGWMLLIRGGLVLFLPLDATVSLYHAAQFERFFYLYLGITLILGLYLAYAGFWSSARQRIASRPVKIPTS